MKIALRTNMLKLNVNRLLYYFAFISYFVFLASDMNYNTAFVDEAIYVTIGEEVLRKIFWESALSWMGGSYLYPIISAYLNRLGGLVAIRTFSAT